MPLLAALCASTSIVIAEQQAAAQTGQGDTAAVAGWAVPVLVQLAATAPAGHGEDPLRARLTAIEALTDLAGRQAEAGPGPATATLLASPQLVPALLELAQPAAVDAMVAAATAAEAAVGFAEAAGLGGLASEAEGAAPKPSAVAMLRLQAAAPTHVSRFHAGAPAPVQAAEGGPPQSPQ
jgi:hypothetical protein